MNENPCSCGIPWRDIDDKCFRCKKDIPKERAVKLEYHRGKEDIAPCKCSDVAKSSWGSRTTNFDGYFLCNFCDLKTSELAESKAPVENEIVAQESETPQKLDIPVSDRTASENLEVVESLLNNLIGTKKYKRAISGGEFSLFSLIGTNDWEDYASLSIDALQLLTLAHINANLAEIKNLLQEKSHG